MSKVALITGITGQDGSFLAELLVEKGYEVHGIIRRASISNTARVDHLIAKNAIKLHDGDLSDSTSLIKIIKNLKDLLMSMSIHGIYISLQEIIFRLIINL